MSDGFNKAILIGNLGADPDYKVATNGSPLLRFNIATNETYRDKHGVKQVRTDWHAVVLWGKRAEALNRILHKGMRVGVEGRLQYHSWKDDASEKTHKRAEIFARDIVLLDGRRPPVSSASSEPLDAADDDIPF